MAVKKEQTPILWCRRVPILPPVLSFQPPPPEKNWWEVEWR
jgi:hypothetical protein